MSDPNFSSEMTAQINGLESESERMSFADYLDGFENLIVERSMGYVVVREAVSDTQVAKAS